MEQDRFRQLLEAYITEKLSAEDKTLFFSLLDQKEHAAELEKFMQEDWETGRYEQEEDTRLRSLITQYVHDKIDETQTTTPDHRVHFLKSAWFRYAAAALIVLTIGAYLWNNTQRKTSVTSQEKEMATQPEKAPPAATLAAITLSNGEKIEVDNVMNGMIATQGNVQIEKTKDGRIVYKGVTAGMQTQYNTFTVPRGSRIASIVLNDGSKVWLNAASSLTYPVAFKAGERRVEITGEAYFEVAKDPSRRFIVKSEKATIEVLGTHFNVNAYPDENATKVSLLEGSIVVNNKTSKMMIRPGQQVESVNGILIINRSADMDQVMAWKNGAFNFSKADLPSVMRQLSRWYDVEIEYEGDFSNRVFSGKISRDINLSDLLDGLQKMNVHFRMEGKKLIVQP